jgi:hypothetical protein
VSWSLAINSWLSSNQVLVVSVMLPLLVLVVTWWINRQNRIAQGAVKLAEIRQGWIGSLRDSVAEFLSCFSEHSPPKEVLLRATLLYQKSLLLVRKEDPEFVRLRAGMMMAFDEATRATGCNEVEVATRRIIEREEERLQRDLREMRIR